MSNASALCQSSICCTPHSQPGRVLSLICSPPAVASPGDAPGQPPACLVSMAPECWPSVCVERRSHGGVSCHRLPVLSSALSGPLGVWGWELLFSAHWKLSEVTQWPVRSYVARIEWFWMVLSVALGGLCTIARQSPSV